MPIRRARAALWICLLASAPGCLWLPNWPWPDTRVEDEYVDPDLPSASHCTPYAEPQRPVLLRRADVVEFLCRLRRAESAEWVVRPAADAPFELPWTVGAGADRLALHGEDLPWSPAPDEAELSLVVRFGGRSTSFVWPLIVLPDQALLQLPGAG